MKIENGASVEIQKSINPRISKASRVIWIALTSFGLIVGADKLLESLNSQTITNNDESTPIMTGDAHSQLSHLDIIGSGADTPNDAPNIDARNRDIVIHTGSSVPSN